MEDLGLEYKSIIISVAVPFPKYSQNIKNGFKLTNGWQNTTIFDIKI